MRRPFKLHPYHLRELIRSASLLLAIHFTISTNAQYTGGDNDGFHSSEAISQSFDFMMYRGGDNDGFNYSESSSQSFSLNIYAGGDNDGFHWGEALAQSFSFDFYKGGDDDGFSIGSALDQAFTFNIYQGGDGDGFTFAVNLIVVPVQLISFTGAWSGRDALLKWTTVTEINNHHFEIQRSDDGQHFTTIGNIPGAGNSTVEKNYSISDLNARSLSVNIIYYRLKQVDLDNRSTYSGVVILKKSEPAFLLTVFPNPTPGMVRIEIGNGNLPAGNWQYRLFNAQGMLLHENSLTNNSNQFDLKKYAAGNYVLQVYHDQQLVQSFKIILTK